jgi:hypothetical protein
MGGFRYPTADGSCCRCENKTLIRCSLLTRGLGDRLSQLEHLLIDAKKKVAEQQDLAAAFLQNQASV